MKYPASEESKRKDGERKRQHYHDENPDAKQYQKRVKLPGEASSLGEFEDAATGAPLFLVNASGVPVQAAVRATQTWDRSTDTCGACHRGQAWRPLPESTRRAAVSPE